MTAEPSANAKWAFETMERFHDNTRVPIIIAILEGPGDHAGEPYTVITGDCTEVSLMIRALVEIVVRVGRPEHCAICAGNYDALCRARRELDRIEGQC